MPDANGIVRHKHGYLDAPTESDQVAADITTTIRRFALEVMKEHALEREVKSNDKSQTYWASATGAHAESVADAFNAEAPSATYRRVKSPELAEHLVYFASGRASCDEKVPLSFLFVFNIPEHEVFEVGAGALETEPESKFLQAVAKGLRANWLNRYIAIIDKRKQLLEDKLFQLNLSEWKKRKRLPR